jgi:hypothetical protein
MGGTSTLGHLMYRRAMRAPCVLCALERDEPCKHHATSNNKRQCCMPESIAPSVAPLRGSSSRANRGILRKHDRGGHM